jgi:hypothetical protein
MKPTRVTEVHQPHFYILDITSYYIIRPAGFYDWLFMMMRREREHENDAKHVKRTASSTSPTKKMNSTEAPTTERNTTLNKMNLHATITLHCCKPDSYLVQAVLVGWASINPQTCFANIPIRLGQGWPAMPQCNENRNQKHQRSS